MYLIYSELLDLDTSLKLSIFHFSILSSFSILLLFHSSNQTDSKFLGCLNFALKFISVFKSNTSISGLTYVAKNITYHVSLDSYVDNSLMTKLSLRIDLI